MHWVTKVFIVGAAVLSVLLASLVMAYSVNVKEIRDSHANLLAQKQQAEADASIKATQFASERNTLTDTISARDADIALLRQQISQLQTEASAARTDQLRAETTAESMVGKIQQISETNKMLTSMIDNYRGEVTSLRDQELKFRQREIELVDRNNDLEARNEVLQASNRALREQVTELNNTVVAIQSGQGNASNAAPQLVNAVRGRVTDVSRDANTGGTLVEINLGSNDGIKERMELWLARNGALLGKLTVIKADLRRSVGRVDTLSLKDPETGKGQPVIRPEDDVFSNPR